MRRWFGALAAVFALALVLSGCSTSSDVASISISTSGDPAKPDTRTPGWDTAGKPINGGPKGEDGSTGNNLDRNFCAHNQDKRCPVGSYVGQFTGYHDKHGYWNAQGQPVNGGPVGANGSTDNNLTQEYCARNQNPGCPKGSYVGPHAQRDPKGGPHYVHCEGSVCHNPNHGAGAPRPPAPAPAPVVIGVWDVNGNPVHGGPRGSDGSTGNNLTRQFCATHLVPACPAGSYVYVAPKPAPRNDAPPEPGQQEFRGPDAPPEPGQGDMNGPNNNDAPPEPGQNSEKDGGDQAPPEPGQGDMQGPNNDDQDGDN